MHIDIVANALMGLFAFSGATGLGATHPPLVAEVAPQTIQMPAKPDAPSFFVFATAYNPVPEQTDGNALITASGLASNPEIVAARSRDLVDTLPFGTIIAISAPSHQNPECGFNSVSDQVGYRVILDVMHARKRQQIDLMFDQDNQVFIAGVARNPADVLGVCAGVGVRIVGHVDLKHVPATQLELIRLVQGTKLAQK